MTDIGYGECPHDDPKCPHGRDCRLEVCTKCGKQWHALGILGRSMCCEARMEVLR